MPYIGTQIGYKDLQMTDSNSRAANQLISALNSLKSAANSANDVKPQVDRINGLLGESISSRVTKETLNNSTTQALVLANLANEAYFSVSFFEVKGISMV